MPRIGAEDEAEANRCNLYLRTRGGRAGSAVVVNASLFHTHEQRGINKETSESMTRFPVIMMDSCLIFAEQLTLLFGERRPLQSHLAE